jgi:hypothetical protein
MKHLNFGVPRCTGDLDERPRVRHQRLGLDFLAQTIFGTATVGNVRDFVIRDANSAAG